jgi:hypothetical protein
MTVGVPHACAGLSSEALAAAIAVPVGVVLLTGGLVTAYCLRRRRKSRERQQQRLLAPQPKAEVRAAVVEDLETGCDDGAGPDAVLSREDDQVGRVHMSTCKHCSCMQLFLGSPERPHAWVPVLVECGVRWARCLRQLQRHLADALLTCIGGSVTLRLIAVSVCTNVTCMRRSS